MLHLISYYLYFTIFISQWCIKQIIVFNCGFSEIVEPFYPPLPTPPHYVYEYICWSNKLTPLLVSVLIYHNFRFVISSRLLLWPLYVLIWVSWVYIYLITCRVVFSLCLASLVQKYCWSGCYQNFLFVQKFVLNILYGDPLLLLPRVLQQNNPVWKHLPANTIEKVYQKLKCGIFFLELFYYSLSQSQKVWRTPCTSCKFKGLYLKHIHTRIKPMPWIHFLCLLWHLLLYATPAF